MKEYKEPRAKKNDGQKGATKKCNTRGIGQNREFPNKVSGKNSSVGSKKREGLSSPLTSNKSKIIKMDPDSNSD